jgi:hypothetical protein
MIELPQTNAQIIRKAMSATNQSLVGKGDYRLVEALLQEGRTVRFRLSCDQVQSIGCLFCGTQTQQHDVNLLDDLFDYLDARIEPCAGVWALGFRCIPTKGEVEVVLEPTGM